MTVPAIDRMLPAPALAVALILSAGLAGKASPRGARPELSSALEFVVSAVADLMPGLIFFAVARRPV